MMNTSKYQIALCGWPGTGTTTVANLLLARLDPSLWRIVNPASKKFRMLAQEKYPELSAGAALSAFEQDSVSKFSVDLSCDAELAKMGEEERFFIADARLAAKFLPESFKIFLHCDDTARFKRIATREGLSVTAAAEQTKAREEASLKRYQHLYGVSTLESQCRSFDFVFDTEKISAEDIVDTVLKSWYFEMCK